MKLINKLNELGLYPLINKPTRIQKDSATLIDNFFANNFSNCHSIILPYSLSDHMITIKLETIHTKKENEDNFIITKKFNEKNILKAKTDLENEKWDNVMNTDTPIEKAY